MSTSDAGAMALSPYYTRPWRQRHHVPSVAYPTLVLVTLLTIFYTSLLSPSCSLSVTTSTSASTSESASFDPALAASSSMYRRHHSQSSASSSLSHHSRSPRSPSSRPRAPSPLHTRQSLYEHNLATHPEMVSELDTAFLAIDANQDGVIDQQELQAQIDKQLIE